MDKKKTSHKYLLKNTPVFSSKMKNDSSPRFFPPYESFYQQHLTFISLQLEGFMDLWLFI